MTALFRFLGFRGVATVVLLAVVFGLMVRVDVLTANRDAARSELKSVRLDLEISKAHVDFLKRDHAAVVAAMAEEQERAVAAEREAAELKALIAKDRDTLGNPETAPVLKNAIGRILKTGTTRQDALFLGRMHPFFRLSVTVDGKVETRRDVRGFAECRDLAAARAVALAKRKDLLDNPRRVSIRCDELPTGGAA